MPKLTIDDIEIEVESGTSVLQAAEQVGVEIPRFCYHEKLSVSGDCGMCLVELDGCERPVSSCCLACEDGMVVRTNTEMVKKARRVVIEDMLATHPLDCLTCDRGGECDLQDQAFAYGGDRARSSDDKRKNDDNCSGKQDNNFSPLIDMTMARCISCTRCIRFLNEIAGAPEFAEVKKHSESDVEKIGSYVFENCASELSGNLIDICPAGALLSKPYKFKARSWELRKTESIDVHDALGCNIRIDSRGQEVMRILPRLNEEINESWIDDRARFSCDGLKYLRLDCPYARDEKSGELKEVSWEKAFSIISENIKDVKGREMAALAGNMVDVEAMVAMKDLMRGLECPNIDCRTDGSQISTDNRASYIFNSGISGIDETDAVILIGTNLRHDAAMLNARIFRNWRERGLPVYFIGQKCELIYPYEHIGVSPKDIEKLPKLVKAKKPMMIIGADVFVRDDALAIHAILHKIAEKLGVVTSKWNGFNVLHKAASRVGGLDIGFLPQEKSGGMRFNEIIAGTKEGAIKALFLLGADEFNARINIGWQTFVVYQGHHGDQGAQRADVVLPSCAYTEKNGLYVNTEGRPQMARKAVSPSGQAREDWAILRALSEYLLDKALPYNTQNELRERIQKEWPVFKHMFQVMPAKWVLYKHKGKIYKDEFTLSHQNYYLSNPICRASPTMEKCAKVFGDIGLIQKEKDKA